MQMEGMDGEEEEHHSNGGITKKKTQEDKKVSGLISHGDNHEGSQINEDGADDDESMNVDPDEIIVILKDFHKKREDRANNAELMGNPRMKKRSNFETEEQKKERIKREERIFWEKMTTVLDEKKLSVWRALDKALSKYYSLLVERQNLIEETGLLNQ